MPVLDVFNNDAFSTTSLSEAIERVEHVPNHLGAMGMFTPNPVRTESVMIEERAGKLSVIQTSKRGAPIEDIKPNEKRKARNFQSVRLAKKATIRASELQFIRAMGEEQAVMELTKEIARRMYGPNGLLADMELTWENHRLGALQGVLLDADDSELYDYFDEFGITKPAELGFDLATLADGDLRKFIAKNVVRAIRRAAKGASYRGIYAMCGDNFWDELIKNPEVRKTYEAYSAAADLRAGYDLQEFNFGGVTFANYIGTDDNSKVAVHEDKVKIFPAGQSGLFEKVQCPGETFADVGQVGKELYAMVIPDKDRDTFVELEIYSYCLHIARRPDVLLSGRVGA